MTLTSHQIGRPIGPFPIIDSFLTYAIERQTMPKPHNILRYGAEPICPRCGYQGYDDWWHSLRDRKGMQPGGKLKCGACEKAFFIEGVPGNLFSSAFGLDDTDRLLRSVGL